MSKPIRIFTDERMRLHNAGPAHPERPERLAAIEADLARGPFAGFAFASPRTAARADIERVHDSKYVSFIESVRGKSARLDADTVVSPHSVGAAYLAAGAAIDAVDSVMRGDVSASMALVRPPGHHAERDRAMGFCIFNNIAIAAAHAIEAHGLERVLIVDWDVHHGNGTQHIFGSRRDVLFISSHQFPLWPGTGTADEHGANDGDGEGEGFTINLPLPPGFDDAGYVALFERIILPIADQYRPQLVLISAGFDAHRDDPLAQMAMTEAGYARLCAMMMNIAAGHANGRIALILEGGYDLNALAGGVRACLETLAGVRAAPAIATCDASQLAVIERLCAAQRPYWRV